MLVTVSDGIVDLNIPTVRTRDIKAAKMLAAATSRGEGSRYPHADPRILVFVYV